MAVNNGNTPELFVKSTMNIGEEEGCYEMKVRILPLQRINSKKKQTWPQGLRSSLK